MTRAKGMLTMAAVALLVGLVGCGARSLYPGGSNNNNGGGNNNNSNSAGNECSADGDCIVAIKHNACCSCPQVVTAAELAADPCLFEVGDPNVPDGCYAICPAIPCEPCVAQGRTAGCDNGYCEWHEGQCTGGDECVVGLRVDNCCEPAIPVTMTDIENDPCLVIFPGWWQEIPDACYEQWDPICEMIDCAPMQPRWRNVDCGADGCELVPECDTPEDCTLLVNARECCSCPEVWPADMVGHDPCLVTQGSTHPVECRSQSCDDIMCEDCGPNPVAECSDGQTCYGDWWDGGGSDGDGGGSDSPGNPGN